MTSNTFSSLGLSSEVMSALETVGYENPSSIQSAIIPHVLEGRDVIGQAQTGTGKTGAFALPLLSRLDLRARDPQILVLTPTRELAIQVSEAFQRYASGIPGFHVLPIYGGTGYGTQLKQLNRGVHVIVGTPGRLCDHLRRGTLKLDNLQTLVIDEADEMLRMGFIEEVEWILEHTPSQRQVTLFSATMPKPIRAIAQRYLKDPVEITIKSETATASTVRQRYWMVSGMHKLDALTRILEGEEFDAIIIFVRTKTATAELATRLEARGYSAAPLNGDIPQNKREETVNKLRDGQFDILVATDVAARGLDVQRISHVINYDIPYDTEAYIHRIGRTGRAGRSGQAILFVAPRERRLLKDIERATRQTIDLMELPTRDFINNQRVDKFRERITNALQVEEDHDFYMDLLESYRQEHNVPAIEIAAALAKLIHKDDPLLLAKEQRRPDRRDLDDGPPKNRGRKNRDRLEISDDVEFATYSIDVGSAHGAKAGNIIGAIANEAGLDGSYIRRLKINRDDSTVMLPADIPAEIRKILQRARVCGRPMNLQSAKQSTFQVTKKAYKKPGPKKKFNKPRK